MSNREIEKALLKMACKSKAVEKLLIDYDQNNKKVIDKHKRKLKKDSK